MTAKTKENYRKDDLIYTYVNFLEANIIKDFQIQLLKNMIIKELEEKMKDLEDEKLLAKIKHFAKLYKNYDKETFKQLIKNEFNLIDLRVAEDRFIWTTALKIYNKERSK